MPQATLCLDKISCMVTAMDGVLLAWIGHTDLRAADGIPDAGIGPIAQAVAARPFDAVVLLSDHPAESTSRYLEWLKRRGVKDVNATQLALSSGITQLNKPDANTLG